METTFGINYRITNYFLLKSDFHSYVSICLQDLYCT